MNKLNTIEDMNKIAKLKGGKCLSATYKGSYVKLQWECSAGHKWWAVPNNVKNGTWCPYCTKYVSENKCRYIFEQLTNRKFPKNNKTLSNRQEIDGYCGELKIGFEYQGKQHYKTHERTKIFTEDKFRYTRQLDVRKKRLSDSIKYLY